MSKEAMYELNKECKRYLITGIIMSIAFVLAIPGVVLGAVYGKWIVMSLCIVPVICGMYVMPIIWTIYGKRKSLLKLRNLILNSNITSLETLASTTGYSVDTLRGTVVVLITQGFLPGYVLNEDGVLQQVQPATPVEQKPAIVMQKCPNCGATLRLDEKVAYCKYCGSKFDLMD